tara:strand:+ start:873 stop:1199 length:327 start_codon:yes stop_codon:yes gene_type:complete
MNWVNYAIVTAAAALVAMANSPAGAAGPAGADRSVKTVEAGDQAKSHWRRSGDRLTEAGRRPGAPARPGGAGPAGTRVSEPSNVIMLGLGLVGLVAGRFIAGRRRKKI